MVDRGFPGKPNTGVSPTRPNTSGLPGWMRTDVKSISAPKSLSTPSTRSCLPIETPPESSSKSLRKPSSRRCRVSSSRSLATGRNRGMPPLRRT